MDKLEDFPPEQQAIEIAKICFDMDLCPSYEKLYHALRSPSVKDEIAAKLVQKECPDVSNGPTSPSDSDVSTGPTGPSDSAYDLYKSEELGQNNLRLIYISSHYYFAIFL